MPKQINFLTIIIGLMSLVIFWGSHVLYKEWRAHFIDIGWAVRPLDNLLSYQSQRLYEFTHHHFTKSRKKGLPTVRLYIPEKARINLMENPPQSTKKWKKAFILGPDKNLLKVKIRHYGDAPRNWSYEKKTWRLKAPKKNLFGRVRVYNYGIPKHETILQNYIAYNLARKVGVMSPRSRMVELFINEAPYGVYNESEHIDENFLRNNETMPVNIYKGEQIYKERYLTINSHLFNNPSLWQKISTFNRAPEDDFSDLIYFLNLIREAETSSDYFEQLKQVARIEDWALFSAYQTLVQAWHNNWYHNQRLVFDPWRGTVKPIVHDTLIGAGKEEYDLNLFSQPLLTLYNKSSDFLLQKHRNLYKFVVDGTIKKTIIHLENLIPNLVNSMSRDKYRHQHSSGKRFFHPVNGEKVRQEWNQYFKKMRQLEKFLSNQLSTPPQIEWRKERDTLALIIDGPVPVDNITLSFDEGTPIPSSIGWDADSDGFLSDGDLRIPFRVEGRHLILEAIWLANQVAALEGRLNWEIIQTGSFNIVPTLFRLVANVGIKPTKIKASSHLTGVQVSVSSGSLAGVTPSRFNLPVVEKTSKETVWSGDKIINEARTISYPLKILAGTRILMKPGASLIFKNRLNVMGTVLNPVVVKPATSEQSWGVMAFHGPKTTGSKVSNIHLENGGEAKIDNTLYSGMLSVHESNGIHFKNVKMSKNTAVDDMMHVVYSKNIIIEDSVFKGAFADALDADISNVTVRNCQFLNSGNDAIDLMSSEALIIDSKLSGSGDKGVSVGEDSRAMVYNTRVNKNSIGIQSKDASIACLINSLFEDNKTHINAFKKNWRYGSGGLAIADKSVFISYSNQFSADKNSSIKVIDSSIRPMVVNPSPRISVDLASDDSPEVKAHLSSYESACMSMLDSWKIDSKGIMRGIIQ